MKRYLETRTVDRPGFMGGKVTETRVVEVAKDAEPPAGATETTEQARDWTPAPDNRGGRG
jgi:hypothetical protein